MDSVPQGKKSIICTTVQAFALLQICDIECFHGPLFKQFQFSFMEILLKWSSRKKVVHRRGNYVHYLQWATKREFKILHCSGNFVQAKFFIVGFDCTLTFGISCNFEVASFRNSCKQGLSNFLFQLKDHTFRSLLSFCSTANDAFFAEKSIIRADSSLPRFPSFLCECRGGALWACHKAPRARRAHYSIVIIFLKASSRWHSIS